MRAVSTGNTDTAGGTRAVDELAWLLRPVKVALTRRASEIVLGLAVLITALAGFAVAGAAVDDRAIAANPATAQAEVLEGSNFARTLVRFTVANGEVWVPVRGVFYPRGLQPGDTVAVEYDVTDPDLVRVAGRGAFGSAGPLLLGALAGWLLLGPLALWIRRRRSRRHPPA
jgi:hypothetical protein